MRTSPALFSTQSDIRFRARRGLTIYFVILVPVSALFEALMIKGSSSWVWALMWTPAAASVVARLMLREGFGDVSFRLGGRGGSKAIGLALMFPIIVGLIVMLWSVDDPHGTLALRGCVKHISNNKPPPG